MWVRCYYKIFFPPLHKLQVRVGHRSRFFLGGWGDDGQRGSLVRNVKKFTENVKDDNMPIIKLPKFPFVYLQGFKSFPITVESLRVYTGYVL